MKLPRLLPLLLALILGHSPLVLSAAAAADRPNIIYILADDLGYGDLGSYGQKLITTPHLDQLATEGMRFTQHYSGATVCAPSRSAFLEGLHGGHASVRGNQPPHLTDPNRVTVAETLRDAGYATAAIGKWGVGHPPPLEDPQRHGFDHFFGYINMWHAHNAFPPFLYRNGERVELAGNEFDPAHPFPDKPEGTGVALNPTTFAPDLIEDEAVAFIRDHQSAPFFLYLALNLPHNNGEARRAIGDGQQAPPTGEFADRVGWSEPDRGFARMIRHIDNTVGRISTELDALGLSENTVLIFGSDNGPHENDRDPERFDCNGPLRGTKRDLSEGGVRVPLIVRWPGEVAAGAVSDHVNAMWDFFPTFAEIAGAPIPSDLDGISFLPTLRGRSDQPQHGYLYWEFHEQGGKQAVRRGPWKAVRTHIKDDQPEVFELFNLDDDLGETTNLASTRPDIAVELRALMTEAHAPHAELNFTTP